MESTSLFHQSVQTGKVVAPSFTSVFDGDVWRVACTYKKKPLVTSHKQKRVAVNSLYGEILAIEGLVQKPSGKNSKKIFLDLGGTYTATIKCDKDGICAQLLFVYLGKTHSFTEHFDSIGSMDRFIKATCALYI